MVGIRRDKVLSRKKKKHINYDGEKEYRYVRGLGFLRERERQI